MLLLEDIFKQLIVETVSRNKILDAIKNQDEVTLYYRDDTADIEVKPGYRLWVHIYIYGKNKSGNDVIRAWVGKGVSLTYPPGKPDDILTYIPGWRMFRVDRMQSIRKTGRKFKADKPKYNPEDKDMQIVYAAVPKGTTSMVVPIGTKTKAEQDLENVKNIKLKQDRGEPLSFAERNILNIYNKRNQ